jgi:hypothetical protein
MYREDIMSRDPKALGEEYRKVSNESLTAVLRSVGEVQRGLQAIASELTEHSKRSVGRTFEIQALLAKKAYETYVSELTKLGQMIFSGWAMFLARAEEQLSHVRPQHELRQRTAAHSVTAKRKTGTAKRPNHRSARAKARR